MLLLLLLLLSPALSIPSIKTLGSTWEVCPLRQMPIVQNFHGSATLRPDVIPGYGLLSLGPITLVPFLGNFQNGTIKVDHDPVLLSHTGWYGCSAIRNASRDAVKVVNEVRMPFEMNGVFQRWEFIVADEGRHVVQLAMDGPFFRQCDVAGNNYSGSCGWGLSLPVDREQFVMGVETVSVDGETFVVMITSDMMTEAVTLSALWIEGVGSVDVDVNLDEFTLDATVHFSNKLVLKWATAVAKTKIEATKLLLKYLGDRDFDKYFQDSCDLYQDRFNAAFDPNSAEFPQNLPVLKTDHPEIDHLYYWAAHAMISLLRTSYPTFPRQYVISEGASNSYSGSQDMGGSGQFLWDVSFASVSYSSLDPEFTKFFIHYIISNSNMSSIPITIPQSWDSYIMNNDQGEYRFDTYSAFLLITTYVTATNNTDFLSESIKTFDGSHIKVIDYLRKLAWSWTNYPRSPSSEYLVNYGDDKRLYLEAVPTYHSVVPALQLCNIGMLSSLARLLTIASDSINQAYPDEIKYLEGNSTKIMEAVIKHQFVADSEDAEGGFWKCIYMNGTAVGVRSIADFMYSGLSISLSGRKQLPPIVRAQSAKYFFREILADGWVRALSLSDPVMSEVYSLEPSLEGKVSMRADWTGTGGYGGVAGFAADSVADLSETLDEYVYLLKNLSYVSYVSMPAQGVAVMTPPYMSKFMNNNDGKKLPVGPYGPAWPEFFDEKDFPPFWPNTARSIQNAEASLCDTIIRTLFGWRPDFFIGKNMDKKGAIDAALYRPGMSRGKLNGKLQRLPTPYGMIDLILNASGLFWEDNNK